jgi:hypothetical protein
LLVSLLEHVKKNDSEYSWVIEILTEFEVIVDSYDRAIQRPKDYQQPKKIYLREYCKKDIPKRTN